MTTTLHKVYNLYVTFGAPYTGFKNKAYWA